MSKTLRRLVIGLLLVLVLVAFPAFLTTPLAKRALHHTPFAWYMSTLSYPRKQAQAGEIVDNGAGLSITLPAAAEYFIRDRRQDDASVPTGPLFVDVIVVCDACPRNYVVVMSMSKLVGGGLDLYGIKVDQQELNRAWKSQESVIALTIVAIDTAALASIFGQKVGGPLRLYVVPSKKAAVLSFGSWGPEEVATAFGLR